MIFKQDQAYDYQSILTNLGYDLRDRGDYWQTNALFRGGDNKTAIQIWKDSGRVKDYVEGKYYSFSQFLYIACDDKAVVNKLLNDKKIDCNEIFTRKTKNFLMQEKTYQTEVLNKLLPHYDFYLNKGIDYKVIEEYKCGLATSGKMYQRLVFPILRKDGLIHGFSGRLMVSHDTKPKWLHMGKKSDWFYPYYVSNSVAESILEKNEVILVESIGDSLSLSNAGYYNNLVIFGLTLSPQFVSKLVNFGLSKIIIAFNNDVSSECNRGLDGALKSIMRLTRCFDVNQLYCAKLPKNDFGEMKDFEIRHYLQNDELINDNKASLINIYNHGLSIKNKNMTLIDDLERFKKKIDYYYE